jgi:hypothetical protein
MAMMENLMCRYANHLKQIIHKYPIRATLMLQLSDPAVFSVSKKRLPGCSFTKKKAACRVFKTLLFAPFAPVIKML